VGYLQVYSVSTHGTYAALVERLVPLMLDAGVALYMSGHDHQLQHLRIIEAAPGQPVDTGSRPGSLLPPTSWLSVRGKHTTLVLSREGDCGGDWALLPLGHGARQAPIGVIQSVTPHQRDLHPITNHPHSVGPA
jgi:hypothetical protein